MKQRAAPPAVAFPAAAGREVAPGCANYPLAVEFLLVAAAVLAFGIGVAHSFLGERYLMIRLLRRHDLPRLLGSDWFTKRTLRFSWHLTTVAWFGLGVILLLIADTMGTAAPAATLPSATKPQLAATDVARVTAAVFGISALMTAVATKGKHLAWLVFGAIAVLTLLGT